MDQSNKIIPHLFTTPPIKAGDSFYIKKKKIKPSKKPVVVNHLQKHFIFTMDEFRGILNANKSLVNELISPLNHQTSQNIIQQQKTRYDLAKMRKSISSKKVTRQLGQYLERFQQALINYCALLEKIQKQARNFNHSQIFTKLDQSFVPPSSLPTLQGIDSQLERQAFNLSDNTKDKQDDFVASSSGKVNEIRKLTIEQSPLYQANYFGDKKQQQSFQEWKITQVDIDQGNEEDCQQ